MTDSIDKAKVYLHSGRAEEALRLLENASRKNPGDAGVRHCLALSLARLGRHEDACLTWQEALRIEPGSAAAHVGLGAALLALGHRDAGRVCLVNALTLAPQGSTALLLGQSLHHPDAAIDQGRRFLAGPDLEPSAAADDSKMATNVNLDCCIATAKGFHAAGLRDHALATLARGVDAFPNDPSRLTRLAIALAGTGARESAAQVARRVLKHAPEDSTLLGQLGEVFRVANDLPNAEDCFKAALARDPGQRTAGMYLGDVLLRLGKTEGAIEAFRAALERDGDLAAVRSALLLALTRAETPDMDALFAEHRRYADHIEAAHRASWPAHGNFRDASKRLKVGILSADLQQHPVAYYLEPVLGHLSRSSGLALHAYSASGIVDRTTRRMQRAFHHWRQIEHLSDAELADVIAADGIDVLIDLSGHTGGNRLPALARKPAPVQATWIGYPYTTGLDAIDYFIGDDYFPPAGRFEQWFSEQIVRLPASVAFVPSTRVVPPNALPALKRGQLSFASFNHASKITPQTILAWVAVLRAVPGSRLLVFATDPEALNRTLGEALTSEGIDVRRLEVRARLPLGQYLLAHHDVDICLDTIPYTGGTTTLHALSMGVPTLTLTSNTPPGYVGASLMRAVGLKDFVVGTVAELAETAVYWASHLKELETIRQDLPSRLASSPIGRPDLIAASLESALRLMWQRWCEGLEPVGIRVGFGKPPLTR